MDKRLPKDEQEILFSTKTGSMREDGFLIVDKFVRNGINEVLDKISKDIQKVIDDNDSVYYTSALHRALEIIDKYRTEDKGGIK